MKATIKSTLLLTIVLLVASCTPQNKTNNYSIKLKGSESLYETFLMLKNDFEKMQDSVKISIEGGGSRTGLIAIKNQEADIGLSSFPFNLDATLGENHGVTEKVVAHDAIVVITNQSNPIKELSDDQINAIYAGEANNWSELGGRDIEITPVKRDENSGTQKFFTEYFKINDVAPTAEVAATNADIVAKVSGNSKGIGFIGFAYFTESVHNLKLAADSTQDEFKAPTHRNIEKGKYPLTRGLRIYYRVGDNPGLEGFLKYLETERAKGIIESFGLIAG